MLAPISGEVVERLVSPGQVVQAGQTQAFTISDLSTVWVLANVYQADLAFVRSGDDVVVQTDAYPGNFHGRISYVSPALDPNTRTLQARIVVDNPGEKLKKRYVLHRHGDGGIYLQCHRRAELIQFCATTTISRLSMSRPARINLAGATWKSGESQNGQTQITEGHFCGRESCGRRQLVSSVCQFAATLRRRFRMIHRIVQFALRQRLLILLLVAFIVIGGAISFHHMPVDAYPDLAPPMVEIITQWPGHAAEEVERLVTVPTEVEMNGVPKMSRHALDLALRPVRCHHDIRRRHR